MFFKARDWAVTDIIRKKLESLAAPETLEFRVGSQVMLVKNLSSIRLVNGSLGLVTAFKSDPKTGKSLPVVAFAGTNRSPPQTLVVELADFDVEDHGKLLARRTQIPLILAWAISIHVSLNGVWAWHFNRFYFNLFN